MVVVGTDVHKRTHTFVAVDEVGRKLGEKVVKATTEGHHQAIAWAREQFGEQLLWGIEDCRNLSARLERDLLTAGQSVVRVAPKLMSQARASARTRGKSDSIDALAVAHAVLRNPGLPVASHDAVSRELKLLIDRREDLVAQRTSTINRLRQRVHELDPGAEPKPASLHRHKPCAALGAWLDTQHGLLAELARDELTDVRRLTETINALAARIGTRVQQVAPALLALPGCGELTAAKIIAEAAGINRFRSEAAFARHTGTAPIPVWSGNTAGRVRLNRSGNRQLNAALHRIAITQLRIPGSAGQVYYRSRLARGKTTKEALRCLKRHLNRTVYRCLHADQTKSGTSQETHTQAAA
ncbi:IS110 family RNA-guided transposase [Mycolicibacterium bacteremicum]|uniref:IS110 family transposase n=1 Tax=Mycolicibacterium bacteremicum TaxID=564198 RepID=A0A1W9YMV0_MYCBA|nr:IS110 family transposase [Mycolicibacterium bacteremicum]MCV7431496.1 IS110 family transposase [Mycolicibacterium bacteremicum]ORA01374.1 IS110 family transposase [Mycolicibacterium bacteremicum]